MYIVVSHWEVLPGHEEQAREASVKMRQLLRSQPGVEFVNGFDPGDTKRVAIHVYRDEAAYNAIVTDSDGPFARGAAETGIENHMRWISSERGLSID